MDVGVLAFGWFLSLFFFGRFHLQDVKSGWAEYVRSYSQIPHYDFGFFFFTFLNSSGGHYASTYLQFWVFTLGAPVVAVLAPIFALKENYILAIVVSGSIYLST